MNNVAVQKSKFDIIKWFSVTLVVFLAVSGNFYLSDQPFLYRFVGVLALAVVGLFIAAKTEQGKKALEFLHDSRIEIRKMVWPTRQETTQTTLVVVAAVLIMALALWVIDNILFKIMQFFTG